MKSINAQSLNHVQLFVTPMDSTTRLLCPWNFPGKNTAVGCHFLLRGIFLTQRWNAHLLCLLHWQVDSLPLGHPGRPLENKYLERKKLMGKNLFGSQT